ncbi:hypothetical protein H206_02080 [Candidatus Electrothrix aarhusensis]|uniref:Uncharacterized protein n=1 Tax=Candidatus Electrothrix aarhusensis TaxID=1859131 RepID=A0A3S3QHP8_9BACT|nr:hypothetical protein H206_02080 [Candidatus Electrothrix aarhusensis]
MNKAVQNALEEAAPTFDSKLIPVMREAITTVQMILFQRLKDSIFQRSSEGSEYSGQSEEDNIRLAGAVVNNLYGSDALDPQVNLFACNHRELIEEELHGIRSRVAELIPHITDSLRMQTLCDNHEGIHSIPCLLLAKELGLLDEERELPLPSTFMLSVRKLGAESGLVKPMTSAPPPLTKQEIEQETDKKE